MDSTQSKVFEKKMAYSKTWDNCIRILKELDGRDRAIFDSQDIQVLCDVSERSFVRLKKDGVELPFGFKNNGKWRFSIDSTVRWLMKEGAG